MSKPTFLLNQPWELTHFPQESIDAGEVLAGTAELQWIPASVPGSVVLDMRRAGLVPDPFVGMNPEEIRPLEYHEWWYRTQFVAPAEFAAPGGRLDLVFEGIDTFADIYLDGELIGSAANMLIPHRIALEGLTPGVPHTLMVRIKSDQYEVSQKDFDGVVELVGNDPSRVWIRKAGHTHGWDIFPRLLSAGIWKPVYLERTPDYSIDDLFVFTRRWGRERCTILARVTLNCPRVYRTDMAVRFRLLDAGQEVYGCTYAVQFPLVKFEFPLENPKMWWPRPYGEPHLYEAEAVLLQDGREIDRQTAPFGIRSIEIVMEDLPDDRQSFYLKINDEPVSLYGTNHVPLDSFPSQQAERLERAIELLDDSRCNCVRVWGGGVYEPQAFYDACDRLGILVWQDFMFSCALYPQEESFLQQVREEAAWVVKALRNHPSVVLYCGDNEIETHLSAYFGPHQQGGNRAIAHELLPEWVTRYDGTRPYWPSSPYTPVAGLPAHSIKAGDTHIWCHGLYYKAPVYSQDTSPFISEIGHLAFPDLATMQSFMPKDKLWPYDRFVLGYRCGSLSDPTFFTYPDGRLKAIEKNVTNVFGALPDDLADLIFATQLVQAEAFKSWIERARRRKFDCGGILWWNLLDGCPQCSDAVVDYYFRKKLAYNYIRRAQDDVLICMEECEGELRVFLVNDNLMPLDLSYQVRCDDAVVMEGRCEIPANSVVDLGSVGAPSETARLYLLRAEISDRRYCNHYLDGRPPFAFEELREYWKRIEEHAVRPRADEGDVALHAPADAER
ncbi:MAG: Exo-beta-D-glucosaminidase precursor [candidate division BRC1 bacterium ADurb.BinA292]|nr:MAG: Exo-beta-D-glucosaminidase precursor [candidate division BRC1 bacterium ADurb.BinA292]